MELAKYSFGIGDRFARQGKALVKAFIGAGEQGIEIVPVWNKSHREHTIIGTCPAEVRAEADEAVKSTGWEKSYFVDADHIGLANCDLFVDASDFFTLDVADFIGEKASEEDIAAFVKKHRKYIGTICLGCGFELEVSENDIRTAAEKYLLAVKEAGKIYRHIAGVKGKDNFVTEISMDETDKPQEPLDMFFILAAAADEGIDVATVAPKFAGRFNKGVDYVGNVDDFARQFEADVAVIDFAVKEFGLRTNLKLSVHSGSDKFSIYPAIGRVLGKYSAGLHVKTAGTTWLEELSALAMTGEAGLSLAKRVYMEAYGRFDELCGPYATVIDIEQDKLPLPADVDKWTGEQFYAAVCHDENCAAYDANVRQLLHVGYKVAAELGGEYLSLLEENEEAVGEKVCDNILRKHILPIFAGTRKQ